MAASLARLFAKCLPAPENVIEDRINIIFSEIKKVFKQNLIPAIVIIILEVIIVVLYEMETFMTVWLEALAEIKFDFGYLYSFLATGLFMGIIPWIFALIKRRVPMDKKLTSFIFMFCMYGMIGVQSDAFYRIQNSLFGDNGMVSVILKVCVDQFIWTVFYMSHVNYWTSWILSNNLTTPVCSKQMLYRYLSQDWIIGLIGGYIIWIPSCITIYSFQEDLQMIMNNLIGCFFVIVMNTITSSKPTSEQHDNDNDDENAVFEIETNEVVNNHNE